MIMLVGEMIGCIVVAAGIGGVVGWLLRDLSVHSLNEHIYDVTAALQDKEEALQAVQLELKAKNSTIQIYEGKIASSEAFIRSTQEELDVRSKRLSVAEEELNRVTERMTMLQSEQSSSLQRFNDSDATIAAFEQEARLANAARTAAQQELGMKEEELFDLQNRLAEVEAQVTEIEQLKTHLAELEPAQGRVHWLEVQLSEKEVQHRAALHDSEELRAAQARRIRELESSEQHLRNQAALSDEWKSKYEKASKQHTTDSRHIEQDRARIGELEATLAKRDRGLTDKDAQLVSLQAEMGKQAEEISRLRKQVVEVRAALRVRGDGDKVVTSSGNRGDQLGLQVERNNTLTESQRDDLKKIRGISPTFERALNRMGTYTYIQIAKWTPADVARVAQQLETAPGRIKRDNWIAGAKKQHREKYGERL